MKPAATKKELESVDELLTYVEFMAALLPNFEYPQMKDMAEKTRYFFRNGSLLEIGQTLPEMKAVLTKQASSLMKDCPPKKEINEIVKAYLELRKTTDVMYSGISFGFLDSLMDLKKFRWYPDMPYHYKIAIGPIKGNGGIEEEFLLKDAFALYGKAELHFNLLLAYEEKLKPARELDKSTYRNITDIKYEISSYSRLSVLAFYSFIECFVNSICFDYLYRHEPILTEAEVLILKGLKKTGNYMNLRTRVESMQTVIRKDKLVKLKLTDEKQLQEPFLSFFNDFEGLRNASVHYSPIKQRIWMGPEEWIQKARVFCDIALQAGLAIWQSCYPESDGPVYMGKLVKQKHLGLAKARLDAVAGTQSLFFKTAND